MRAGLVRVNAAAPRATRALLVLALVLAAPSVGRAQDDALVQDADRGLAALLAGAQTASDPEHTPRLGVPRVVEVASEVPVTVTVPLLGGDQHYIRRVILFDENSLAKLKYVATFSPRVRQARVATAIKMAKDSRLGAIAECSVHGRFLALSEEIRVGVGGCGAGQEPSRELAGEVLRVRFREEGELLQASLLFRHPMMSGYAVNDAGAITKRYEPFFLESARVSHRGEAIVELSLGPGLSDNPQVSFLLPRLGSEPLQAEAVNNAGQRFSLAVRLPE